ncbi:hypothetical protein LTR62_000060 [Meristemomyces frigidus]|uniref:Acyltransferase MbtK/IucB-like conserved domain-containing protein n=1 Tax=Meristemomyces frigidus TaxID=1508187 RepID=A0AAN7TXF1_9PEZI|nr:hypothetical protein LTR62_000060 [Meristemomyces frigidus]
MPPSIVHLPNGQTLTVNVVFGGIQFKANELNPHHNAFPAGWTIVIHSEDFDEDHLLPSSHASTISSPTEPPPPAGEAAKEKKHHVHRFRKPTLRNDHLFISTISNPSSNDFRPANSPTRQIAMMLWATLWWYYHQPPPSPYLTTAASQNTPEEGRPKGEWIVNINREGIFKGKHLLPKLERMGLVATEDSSVGVDPADGVSTMAEGWNRMFVSQRTFWQLDARIYLFTLSPTQANSPFPSVSPAVSRSASPSRNSANLSASAGRHDNDNFSNTLQAAPNLNRNNTPPGPFTSGSNLPTFYPPPPAQYTFTNGIRHPVRPKPPRQGETFYTRWIPSLGQYLSFRVASLSKQPCVYHGPTSTTGPTQENTTLPQHTRESLRSGTLTPSDSTVPKTATTNSSTDNPAFPSTTTMTDTQLLHKWMNDPRVAYSWGEDGPLEHQEQFLTTALSSRHSFPVIASFDGKPFAYFELYWVREDRLSAHLPSSTTTGGAGSWDRGLHVLVGEQEFRGSHRVKVWLSALVHWCWLSDLRTERVVMEPRVDNGKLRGYCEGVGFWKEGEVSLGHKQSNLMVIRREGWVAPAL